jgi:shikimate dehydrogenase
MNSTNHQSPITNYQLGLIGYPLGHSLSPKIHIAALKACGLKGEYSLFPIAPEDKQGLKDLLARVRSGEIHGLNVTIRQKPSARSIPFTCERTNLSVTTPTRQVFLPI